MNIKLILPECNNTSVNTNDNFIVYTANNNFTETYMFRYTEHILSRTMLCKYT